MTIRNGDETLCQHKCVHSRPVLHGSALRSLFPGFVMDTCDDQLIVPSSIPVPIPDETQGPLGLP